MSGSERETRRTPENARATTRKRDWTPAFLEALKTTRMVSAAARDAGVSRSTVYLRRNVDEEFRERWDEIDHEVTDALEREAFRRAALGVERDVWFKGEVVGREKDFSDTLLIFLLKARKPTTYRDNVKVEHSGPDGGPVRHQLDLTKLSDEQLRALEAIQPDADRPDEA